MMVTILLGEQGAMIALCSHSDPPLIHSNLRRPGSSHSGPPFDLFRLDNAMDNAMDGYTQAQAERQRERHYYAKYDIRYSRLNDIKGHIITRGRAVLCIIGLWSFHRKKIADHVGPICSIVIMALLRTLISDYMITVR